MTTSKTPYAEALDHFRAARAAEKKKLASLNRTALVTSFTAQVKAEVILKIHARYVAWVEHQLSILDDDSENYIPGEFNERAACWDGSNDAFPSRALQSLVPRDAQGNYPDLLKLVVDDLSSTPDVYGLHLEILIREKGYPDTAFIAIGRYPNPAT